MPDLFSPRRPTVLVLLLLLLGGGVFFSFYWKGLEKKQAEREASSEPEVEQEDDLPQGWASLDGLIFPAGGDISGEVSHKLVNEDGDVLMLLTASDEKLTLAENMEVEVQGPVRLSSDGKDKVMRVETIVWGK
ncbi:MAG: hypothetical protein ACOC6Q_02940 [Patescibacteria group bacterium]